MSGPPTPRAAQLNAPALQVCESAFTSTVPGGISLIGNDRMADALIGADIVQTLDAELLGECAPGLHALRSLHRRRRHQMIEDNHHSGWIGHLQDLAPAFRQKG